MEIAGKIKVVFDAQTFNSGFRKREFVVTTQEQYPQDIKLELYNDKCDVIDAFKVGDEVTVGFNLRGNEYNGKYFVNLNAWKIDAGQSGGNPAPAAGGSAPSSATPPSSGAPMPSSEPIGGADEDDDLPF